MILVVELIMLIVGRRVRIVRCLSVALRHVSGVEVRRSLIVVKEIAGVKYRRLVLRRLFVALYLRRIGRFFTAEKKTTTKNS